jgi:hypothetical protein
MITFRDFCFALFLIFFFFCVIGTTSNIPTQYETVMKNIEIVTVRVDYLNQSIPKNSDEKIITWLSVSTLDESEWTKRHYSVYKGLDPNNLPKQDSIIKIKAWGVYSIPKNKDGTYNENGDYRKFIKYDCELISEK